jgi:heme A synthase
MSENSPISRLILVILHRGSIATVALMLLFIGINLWQHITPDKQLVIEGNDRGFLGVMVVLLVFAIYLVWSIGKELKKT